jgi:hypothetical protein
MENWSDALKTKHDALLVARIDGAKGRARRFTPGGFLPRIVLMPDFDRASRAQGEWLDPARVVHHAPRAGPPLASDDECPDDER